MEMMAVDIDFCNADILEGSNAGAGGGGGLGLASCALRHAGCSGTQTLGGCFFAFFRLYLKMIYLLTLTK